MLIVFSHYNICMLKLIKHFSIRRRVFQLFWIKSFYKPIFRKYCKILLWFTTSFSISAHRFKSVLSWHHVESKFYLDYRFWNSNAANLFKSLWKPTEKYNFSCLYKVRHTHFWETITAEFICSPSNLTAVHFLDKLKLFRIGPFKIINKPTEVTYELLTQDVEIFHTHKKETDFI